MSDNITFYNEENILNGIMNLHMNKHKEERIEYSIDTMIQNENTKENTLSETLPNNINRISKFKSTIEYTKLMILSNNMQSIISYHQMEKEGLGWGNGMGDRLFGKNVNYTLIYHSGKMNCYSENDNDKIPILLLEEFLKTMNVERSLNRITNSQKKVQGEINLAVVKNLIVIFVKIFFRL